MNYGNLEKINSVILRPASNFTIKNVVQFGRRNYRTGRRDDVLKQNVYDSNKYSNYGSIAQINVETSDFLVFNCSSLNDPSKFVDIFMSYQHIKEVRRQFSDIYNFLNNEENEVFKETEESLYINPKFEEKEWKISNLVNGKSVVMIPDILEIEENEDEVTLFPAITLYFNDEDIYTTVKLEDFEGIVYFLENFNLLSSSQNLMMFAYLNQMANSMNLQNYNIKQLNNMPSNRAVVRKNSTNKEEDNNNGKEEKEAKFRHI